MKVMRASDSGPAPLLVEDNIPRPQPGRGELLIQIYAAVVTPMELLWYPTTHNKDGVGAPYQT
jgi:NADPH:quinone reductase-like Zn-dependent oxidoreductase